MARYVDDVIRFVENYPHLSDVEKELLRLRLEPKPSQEELNKALNSLLNRKAAAANGWEEKPEAAMAVPTPTFDDPPLSRIDASDDPPPPPAQAEAGTRGYGPFHRSS